MARSIRTRRREVRRVSEEERDRSDQITLEQTINNAANANQFLTTSEFDDTDGTYYFYGGVDSDLDWKINRYTKSVLVRTSADLGNNPTKTSLDDAWTDRLTITYS